MQPSIDDIERLARQRLLSDPAVQEYPLSEVTSLTGESVLSTQVLQQQALGAVEGCPQGERSTMQRHSRLGLR